MNNESVASMTEGNPAKLILLFTLPMLIGNLFQQFYNMADSVIVGRYVGANALAAVGATGSINFLFFSLSAGIALGVGVIVSQAFGAGKPDMVEKSIANGMYLLLLVSLIFSILGVVLSRTILVLLDTPEVILDDAVLYMQVTCAGILAIAVYNGVASILRALGDSKTPLYFMLIACVINIVLDLIFVIQFEWAVFGAAFATVIAQVLSAIGVSVYALHKVSFFRIKREHRALRMDIVAKCFRLGMPIALQNSMIAVSCVFLQKVVNSFGENVVAANTALGRIEQLVQQPFGSLGAALTTYTGQNIGAGKIERVKRGYRVGLLSVVAISLVMLIPGQFFGREIVGFFVQDEEVIAIGARGLAITSWFYFFLGMIYVARSVLNGVGDAMYAMINGVMEIVGRIGFAIPLTMIPFIGMWGIFFTTGFTWAITGIVSMYRYAQGKWCGKVTNI